MKHRRVLEPIGHGETAVFDRGGSPTTPRGSKTPASTQVTYTDVITVTWNPLPPGTQVERAVLMAPGSVTHHFDMHQRYVALEFAAVDETQGLVTMPRNATYAPPGYYMLILVTSGGVPSVATWIWLR